MVVWWPCFGHILARTTPPYTGWSSDQFPKPPNQAPMRASRTSTSAANITSATLNIYEDRQQSHPFRPEEGGQ